MSYLKKQLKVTRSNLLKEIEGLSPEFTDIQPTGFNNTIHWHLGHVLTVAEKFLFGSPKSNNLPDNYGQLFGYGSKPSDWTGDVPSIETLKQQLQEQLDRILAIPEETYHDKVETPFMGMETVEDFISTVILHETNHIGQMHAMKLLIQSSN
ncbi:DinB family protein [Peribacillus sp. NPDC097675]|uniref:DinB family protein n=1 Tax=Peribacillus sp. NPDC097675 TaxID=3390618 RepID=UPI003D08CFE0